MNFGVVLMVNCGVVLMVNCGVWKQDDYVDSMTFNIQALAHPANHPQFIPGVVF